MRRDARADGRAACTRSISDPYVDVGTVWVLLFRFILAAPTLQNLVASAAAKKKTPQHTQAFADGACVEVVCEGDWCGAYVTGFDDDKNVYRIEYDGPGPPWDPTTKWYAEDVEPKEMGDWAGPGTQIEDDANTTVHLVESMLQVNIGCCECGERDGRRVSTLFPCDLTTKKKPLFLLFLLFLAVAQWEAGWPKALKRKI